MDLMEQNLARLLSQEPSIQNSSQEPADPFQKAHFGKKMRKSKVSTAHLSPHYQFQVQDEETIEMKGLFNKLKVRIDQVENRYLQKLTQIKYTQNHKEIVEQMMAYLEGSVDFITNDCLRIEDIPRNCRKTQKENRAGEEKNVVKVDKKAKGAATKVKTKGRSTEKSVYESVLEQRERRAKRRML